MHDALFKLHLKQQVPPSHYNALVNGLYLGCGAIPPNQHQAGNDTTQEIQQEQERLGWKQLYYGRITTAWANSLNASQSTINGVVFYAWVILLIWQAVLAQWKVCNQHWHPPNSKEEDHTQLEWVVYQIIQEVQADPNPQDLVSSFYPNMLLRRPIKYICQWIKNSRNHMQAQQKAASTHAQLYTFDIRSFLPISGPEQEPSTNEKNLLWPP